MGTEKGDYMATHYRLAKVREFIDRIREEKSRAERLLVKAQEFPAEYKPDTVEICRAKMDLCDDLISIAELKFGPEVSWEGKE